MADSNAAESNADLSRGAQFALVKVTVRLGLDGEHICTVQRSPADTVGSLLRAVTAAAPQLSAFDLLLDRRVLRVNGTLLDEGIADDAEVTLIRRKLRASDISVNGFSDEGVGGLCIVYHPSGAQLRLRGQRAGSDKCSEILSCEMYAGPTSVEDIDYDVYVYYQKTVGKFSSSDSLTSYVRVRRRLRMRTDMAVARHADGGMWVSFKSDRDAEPEFGATVFSGMRLDILDASHPEWVHARCHKGEGWVRRQDTSGIGEVSIDWAGPEEILTSSVADQENKPLFDYRMLS
eukprot:TRINITY_DN8829_c0_g1_i1.p2 TRINITY_DN8829_c0_g1~~TRINITY_DN8829_c0_g1_i1.p2  ORF type:complete len:290 (+),score=25.30 TRINITY_DN8829_c0_g1_i1:43-912(+)